MPNDLAKLRVYVKKGHVAIYQRLKDKVFSHHHTLFALAVFLGYKTQKPIPTINKKDLFWSDTFSQDELNGFYALFVLENEKGRSALLEDKSAALTWLQEYANAGIDELINSSCLKKYVHEVGSDYDLVFSNKDLLPKQILFEIFGKYKELNKK